MSLISPEAGDPGDTFATHAGRLRLNPQHPTDGIRAVVEADSAVDAVRSALSGAIVARVGGRSSVLPFKPATVGQSAAEKLSYRVEMAGEAGRVWLEDLARRPSWGADWDYNDRSWRVDVRPYAGPVEPDDGSGGGVAASSFGSGTLIHGPETNLWSGPGGSANVTVTVTYESDDTYLWHYQLDNLTASFGEWGGIGIFHLPTDQWEAVIPESLWNSKGWYQHVVPETGGAGGVWWESGEFGEVIPPLDYGEFSFKTEPLPVATLLGEFADPNYGDDPGGQTKGPGVLPTVDIDIDSNRDGLPTQADEPTEETDGTVVIADRDNVYKAPAAGERDDRAVRKEVIVHSNLPAGSLVRVMRTHGNVKLYTQFRPEDQGGNVDLFGANDEITIKTETTYYLGGGDDPSSTACETLLKVRPNLDGAPYQDQVAVTVLWVDISGKKDGPLDPFTNPQTYEYDLDAIENTGFEDLGVHFGTPGSTIGEMAAAGMIRIDGQIEPKNYNWTPSAPPLSHSQYLIS